MGKIRTDIERRIQELEHLELLPLDELEARLFEHSHFECRIVGNGEISVSPLGTCLVGFAHFDELKRAGNGLQRLNPQQRSGRCLLDYRTDLGGYVKKRIILFLAVSKYTSIIHGSIRLPRMLVSEPRRIPHNFQSSPLEVLNVHRKLF